jgi:glycosyltransferase involved in cell wall biosynthesis
MIVSNVSSLPEVGGEAVLTVDPLDVVGLADHIERLLGDAVLKDKLLLRAKERLAEFTWHKTARETMQLLKSVKPKSSC